ncbi:MAG: aryl-sulfate sulfotransferase [Pseudomonadales bacterium]
MTWVRQRPEGLVYRDAEKSFDGYTLYCSVTGKHATLLDPEGAVVHRWHCDEGIQHAHMLENGHLLIQTAPFRYAEGRQNMGGNAGAMMELDWDSRVVWAYRNPAQHHAYERLPNGNHILLAWYPVPTEYREQVRGGHPHEKDGDVMWGDVILEIDRSGHVQKRWNSWEHFDFEQDQICPLESRKEWGHANSLCTTPDGDYLVSFRGISRVMIIDSDSGAVKWRYGAEDEKLPMALSHQHAATWLDNGNVLIFDNGCHRPRAPAFSRVIEVDPDTRDVVWQYQADVILAFFSFMCSGASRLPNGNTLITESSTGRLFEVTPEGETVWEFVSPFHFSSRFGRTPFVFRAYRYALDDPRFAGRALDPADHAELNRLIRERRVPDDYHEG